MSNLFSDIDAVWKDKRVEFISGKHQGKTGTCTGFINAYGGAGLQVITDNAEYIMVYSRDMDNIKKVNS